MKQVSLFIFCILFVCCNGNATEKNDHSCVRKIWDNGNHCAFTSLIKFKGNYYCSFREGDSHIFDKDGNAEGKVRIIVSTDGEKWESVACMAKKTFDLRDPKLSVTPDGKLMVIMGGSIYKNKVLEGRIPHVSYSSDGKTFSDPVPINLDKEVETGNDWLWRVTWDDQTGYGVNYSLLSDDEAVISLVKTTDGTNYQLVSKLDVPDFPNETTVRILPDKRMVLMVRRERGDQKGYWGVSNPPYKEWTWTKMEMRLGGPDFISLGKDVIVAGTRSHYIPSFPKTVLLTGNEAGKFQETVVLPSGGDTSYPGFIIEGNELWVSYYASHETKMASVYLAKIPLSVFMDCSAGKK